jgi:PAS domain S-box-containing protein
MEQKNPTGRLDKRLWFSLVLFAGLIILHQFLIQPALIRMTSDAPAINLAGRQRMLSQKLAKAGLAMVAADSSPQREVRRQELIETLQTWRDAHADLRSKGQSGNLVVQPASDLILQGFREIEPHFQKMVTAAETLLVCSDDVECRMALSTLLQHEPEFLIGMNSLVGLYENEARRHVRQLQLLGLVIMVVILGVQLAMQFGVVRPQLTIVGREWEQIDTKYQLLVESMTDGLVVFDPQGQVEFSNRRFNDLLGRSIEEIVGRPASVFISATDRRQFAQLLTRTEAPNGPVDLRLVRSDGRAIDTLVSSRRMIGADGQFVRLLLVVTDVTDRKAAEQRSRVLQTQLAHEDRLKSMGTMAAALAHEIHQPLGAISNYAEGCLERLSRAPMDPTELIRPLQAIRQAAHRGAEIVRRTRSFAGRRPHELTIEAMNELVCEVEELCRPEARRRGISIELQLAEALPTIPVDAIQIQQVLTNLLQNAFHALERVKTDRRRILLITRQLSDDELEIAVADTGPGLPSEGAQSWFEPFVTTADHGTGLGLAIARGIVESHGGRIWHEAIPEGGACFQFTLPLNPPSERKEGTVQSKGAIYVG